MTQIERIERMESILDKSTGAISELAAAIEKYSALIGNITELSKYYGSAEWFSDVGDSNNGKLPKDLKCGVLSEDAVYDLLTDNRTLAITMLEVATKILK